MSRGCIVHPWNLPATLRQITNAVGDATIAAVMAEKYLEAHQLRLPWR